ncbi:hypothetical protein [Kushneria aurantia]|uniref:Nitrite/Sulfite reductase ferredoxin-like domain-containing protein n=1 Tax=Kushneria aurantia TaxID=504092 RepID=A0ABV6G745_9GAMM|nr:hypothetical protein [Kushneria aurantia]
MLPHPHDFSQITPPERIRARGACPSLSAPMETGDGWLARLPPLAAPLEGDEVIALCEAAERFGNGLIEVTRRGNLQLRGLAEQGHRGLADYLDARLVRHRLTTAVAPAVSLDPLMESDEAIDDATRALARQLRERIMTGAPAGLAAKSAVVIDSGGWGGLATLSGDIHLRLDGGRGGWIGIAGDHQSASWLGWVVASRLASAVNALLFEQQQLGGRARGGDLLRHHGRFGLCDMLGCRLGDPPPRSGVTAGPDGHARHQRNLLDVVWPFGQLEALALLRFTRRARELGALAFAAAPHRHWRILCHEHADLGAIAAVAAEAGLIVAADDPRLAIVACSGAPACASARFSTRDGGRALVPVWSRLFDKSVGVHLSGCHKGCASLDPCSFTLVGRDDGIGLVFDGNPRGVSRPVAASIEALRPAFEHLARRLAAQGLVLPLSAAVLSEVGEERVVTLLREGSGWHAAADGEGSTG